MGGTNGNGHTVEREDFAGRELTTTAERQTSAVVARVTAEIQARSIVALKRPRDIMQFRSRLLEAARRPSFAEVAEFAKPIGKQRNEETGQWEEKYARGPSIRFVEEALRCFGNNVSDIMVTEDDADSRTIHATSTDLENNVTFSSDFTLSKRVERSKVREGQKVLATRTNSYGKQVFIVEATEDEIATKQGAQASKAIRTNGARLLPGDIVEEARRVCKETLAGETKKDPTAALKKLVDAFGGIGVRPEMLAEYLGHPVAECTLDEMGDLREIGTGIKEGHTTWREVMAVKNGGGDEDEKPEAKGPSAAEKLKAKLAETQKASAKSQPEAAKPAAQPEPQPEGGREPGEDDDAGPEPPQGALRTDAPADKRVAPKTAPRQVTLRMGGNK